MIGSHSTDKREAAGDLPRPQPGALASPSPGPRPRGVHSGGRRLGLRGGSQEEGPCSPVPAIQPRQYWGYQGVSRALGELLCQFASSVLEPGARSRRPPGRCAVLNRVDESTGGCGGAAQAFPWRPTPRPAMMAGGRAWSRPPASRRPAEGRAGEDGGAAAHDMAGRTASRPGAAWPAAALRRHAGSNGKEGMALGWRAGPLRGTGRSAACRTSGGRPACRAGPGGCGGRRRNGGGRHRANGHCVGPVAGAAAALPRLLLPSGWSGPQGWRGQTSSRSDLTGSGRAVPGRSVPGRAKPGRATSGSRGTMCRREV